MTQDKPRRMPSEFETKPASEFTPLQPELGYVPRDRREGVFIHSFICNRCGLHFNVYSWFQDRHTVKTIHCPECGQHEGRFRHFRVQVSELTGAEMRRNPSALLNSTGEIYRFCPAKGAAVMSDTTMAGLKDWHPERER